MPTIIKTAGKLNLLALGAALITVALFYLMQMLVRADQVLPAFEPLPLIAEITLPEPEPIEPRREDKPEQPDPPAEMPPLDRIATLTEGPRVVPEFIDAPPVVPDAGQPVGPGMAEGNALALVQVQPVYPVSALNRGIEGYVVLEFDVSENGQVVDPRVLYADPEGVFERSALNALERWRYKPKVVDGEEVKMFGVQQKMSFSIAD